MDDQSKAVYEEWSESYSKFNRKANNWMIGSILMIIGAFILAFATNGWQFNIHPDLFKYDFKNTMMSLTAAVFLLVFGVFLLIHAFKTKSVLKMADRSFRERLQMARKENPENFPDA